MLFIFMNAFETKTTLLFDVVITNSLEKVSDLAETQVRLKTITKI